MRQYYHWVPAEDLADRNPLDLYGAAVAHWNLAQQRAPGEAKVHVYNPDFEQHGWQSPHTVIEIVTRRHAVPRRLGDDGAGRQGYRIDLVIHPVIRVRRDADGTLLEVLEPGAEATARIAESIIHVEVDREHRSRRGSTSCATASSACSATCARAVEDWQAMRARADR